MRQQQPTRDLLDLKIKCAEVGRRFHPGFVRDLRGAGRETPLVPRFAYNAKLNTCIYRGGSFDKAGSFQFIVDLTTNEELASYLDNGSMDDTAVLERAKFNQRQMELFGPKSD
ncbi:MAG: hypothetical protein KIT09_29480 [Bryobacteraceae bacterium]|nr:hypothetical protein [Bryobacteraceae bacterium]